MAFPEGKVVIGKIVNTAINAAAVEVVFKDINGRAVVLAANQRIIWDTIRANNRATAKDITFFQDANGNATYDAGEEIIVFSFAAAGVWTDVFVNGLPSLKINAGATNKIYAVASAAGAVDITMVGQIIND